MCKDILQKVLKNTCYGLDMRWPPKAPVLMQEYSKLKCLYYDRCNVISQY